MGKAKAKAKAGPLSYVPSPCRIREEPREVELLGSPQPKSDPQDEEEVVIQPHPSADCSLSDAFDLARKAQAAWEDAAKACSMDLGRKLAEQTKALEVAYASKIACEKELQQRLTEIEELKGQLEQLLTEKDTALNEARTALQEAQKALEEKKIALQELEREVSQQQELKAALQMEFDAVKEESSTYKSLLTERMQETEDQAAELETLKEGNKALEEQVCELTESMRGSEAREEDLKRDILRQQETSSSLQTELDTMKEECANYKSQLDAQSDEADRQAAQLKELKEAKQGLDARVSELLESLAASEAREEEQRELQQAKHVQWEEEKATLLKTSEEALAEQQRKADLILEEALEAGRSEWEARLEAVVAERESKWSAHLQSALAEERSSWEAKCSSVESAAKEAKAEADQQLTALSAEAAELRAKLEAEQAAVADLEELVKEERTDRIALESKLLQKDDHLAKLQEAMTASEAIMASFDEKMDVQKREFQRLVEEKAAALEDAEASLQAARTSVEPLEREAEFGREKIAKLTELLEKANLEIFEQQQQLESKDMALKDRLEDLEAVVERTQELQSRNSQLEVELEEAEAMRRCLDLNLVASHEELSDERQRVEEFSNRIAEMSKELEEHMLIEGSSEELRVQNRELVVSVNQFKRDCELLGAEVVSLKNNLAIFESDLERVQGHNAELSGHVNHKQKIRHTMQLKEEIGNLRKKLGVAHEKITKLEVESFGVNFFEALASLGVLKSLEAGHSQHSHFSVHQPPGHSGSSLALGLGSVKSAATSHRRLSCGGTFREDLAFQNRYYSLERRCTLQQRALEKVSVDFAHFLALIERAVYLSDGSEQTEVKVSHSMPQLLQELRDVVDRLQSRRPDSHRCARQEHS